MKPLLYRFGRLLQILAMIILPVAIVGNLSPEPENRLSLGQSLLLSSVGILVFGLGWLIQQAGRGE